jgi:serine/threonine protein kinase
VECPSAGAFSHVWYRRARFIRRMTLASQHEGTSDRHHARPVPILARLGQGGMGEVFLAEDPTLRRRVPLKLLSSGLGGQPQWVSRLRREAIALAAVNHPNVVTIHAVSEADGQPFVVMELTSSPAT